MELLNLNKMTKKNLLYGGISIAVILMAFVFSSYLISTKPAPRKDDNKINTVYVKADKVNLLENKSDMTYRGRVTAFDNVSLAAEVQGKIMQGDVRFKAGESFTKNDVLVKIYCEDVEASLKSGISSFLQTLSKILPDLKVDYPDEYEKWSAFFNAIDVGKPMPVLPEIDSNKEKVFLAANNVLASYYTLQQREINLRRYTIYAPFSGSFKSVNKEIGAIASPGAELATIIRSDKLEVVVPIFPSDLQWIKKGDKVKVTSNHNNIQTATISRISGFVDEATQSVNTYLTYHANGKNSFLQGQYVDVVFKGGTVTGFEIPREALVGDSFVYVLTNKKLKKVHVDILRQLNDTYIIAGITADKIIVTESLANISSAVEYLAR
jgi:HlyD family secretion protein